MSLVLYGAPLSPFVRKVDIVLREKGLEFEAESVMMPFPDWFLEISPARRMPVLRDKAIAAEGTGGTIPDSSAICGYLERRCPEPAVYPADAFDFGRALWLEEWADSELAGAVGLGLFRPLVFPRMQGKDPDLATAKTAWHEKLPRFFDYIEQEIEGKEFLVGGAFSIADIAVACQLINVELVAGLPDGARWPGLVAFAERMASRPSFAPNLQISKKVIPESVDLSA